MDKTYLFGLGTGRCGTVSLATLLNLQLGACVTHESKPWLYWHVDRSAVQEKVRVLTKRKFMRKAIAKTFGLPHEASVVGDVALFNLQSVETLLEFLPSAKFIALKRDRKETIDSFKRKWKPKYNRICYKRNKWDLVFPHYELPLVEAVNKYYSTYYNEVMFLEGRYPQNVKCFNTQVLNSEDGVKSILNFCGIPENEQICKIGIKTNQGKKRL